jgi:F-type H+-transporting ATPase subunit b
MFRQPIVVLALLGLGLVVLPPNAVAQVASESQDRTKAEAHGNPAAAAPAASTHEPTEETPNILRFEPDLAFWTFIVFVLLLVTLGKFAWKPLIKAMEEREEHIEHCLLESERARNESERLLEEHRKQLAAAADQVRAIRDEVRRDAQVTSEEILGRARAEADAERQRTRREIETARDQALVEIWNKAADLAVSVAGKVLSRELNEGEHRRLVDAAVSNLPPAPGSANGHGSRTA